MWFGVLGPVEMTRAGEPVDVGPPSQRFVLAVLLLEANRVVPVERLIELAWPGERPRTARVSIQVRISRLRSMLDDTAVLATEASGYVLRVDPETVDAHRFQRLVAQADDDDPVAAVALLREALDLWRGPALAGAASEEVRERLTVALEEQRLATVERLAELLLRLGRHTETLDDLHRVLAVQPGRERAVELLARALHAGGQTTRSLDLLRGHRERLADELGLDPGPRLRELEVALLRGDVAAPESPPASDTLRSRTRPAQLPAAPGRFRGRATDLAALDAALAESDGEASVVTVTGMPGVGKTALALQWAHQAAERFGDGQLFVDLRGHAAEPALTPRDALAGFLRALGAEPTSVPPDVTEAAADFRSRLAGTRTLVVLDNAGSVEQVRPLLPGTPGCVTVVTSRYRLDGLVAYEGARRLTLEPLPDADARDVLTATLGPGRADETATDELVALCGGLPLALRIAAANIGPDEIADLAGYVRQVRTGPGLGYLAVDDDSAVRTAFDVSYRRLDADAQRAFRRIALVPGVDVTVAAVAALLDSTEDDAARLLRSLARAHLVDAHRRGRHRLHDLLRVYAAERVIADDTPGDRGAAHSRLVEWYAHATAAAVRAILPDRALPPLPDPAGQVPTFRTPEDAIGWLDAEAGNVVAAVLAAATDGPAELAWRLAAVIRPYFVLNHDLVAWRRVTEAVQGIATDDTLARAASALMTGELAHAEFRYADAEASLGEADRLCAEAGWPAGRLDALSLLAAMYARSGRSDAERLHGQVLELANRAADNGAAGRALSNLGLVAFDHGRLEEGVELLRRGARLLAECGAVATRSNTLSNLGAAYKQLDRYDEALDTLLEARDLAHRSGRRTVQVAALNNIADLYLSSGLHAEALKVAEEALPLAAELRRPRSECAALCTMAAACRELNRLDDAGRYAERALAVARDWILPHPYTQAHLELAETGAATGDVAAARRHAEEALASARSHDYRTEEARALLARSSAHRAAGDLDAAAAAVREALAAFQAIGNRQDARVARQRLDELSPET